MDNSPAACTPKERSARIAEAIIAAAVERDMHVEGKLWAIETPLLEESSVVITRLLAFAEFLMLPAGSVVLACRPHHQHLMQVADYPLDFSNAGAELQTGHGLWCTAEGTGVEELIFASTFSASDCIFYQVESSLITDLVFSAKADHSAAPQPIPFSHWTDWVPELAAERRRADGRFKVNCRILGVDPAASDARVALFYGGLNAQFAKLAYDRQKGCVTI